MDENLMEFSQNCENSYSEDYCVPMETSPVTKKSILKPSQHDNLINLCTPVHKGLKVKFETPHNVKKSTPTRFKEIKMLDEKENWLERTAVVTKAQHQEYLEMAQEIMLEVINNLPLEEIEKKTSSPPTQDADKSHPVAEENGLTYEEEKGGNVPSNEEQTINSEEKRESEEDTKTEGLQNAPASPPLPAAKGSYNIDFDNLDEVNPFVTKAAVQNSPESSKNNKVQNSPPKTEEKEMVEGETENKENNGSSSEENDGSKSEQKGQVFDAIIAEQADDIFSQSFEDIDPFQPKKQLMNSPQVTQKTDSKDDTLSLPECGKDSGLMEKEEVVDPFVTKTKVTNTPTKNQDVVESLVTHSKEVNSQEAEPMEVEEMSDPFATKSKVVNSPGPSSMEGDGGCMKEESKTDSSSDKNLEMETSDPFKTVSKIADSPVKEDSLEVDPFATKAKVANSPCKEAVTLNEEADPFATKAKVANSPCKEAVTLNEEADPFATKAKVANSPVPSTNENNDPFATKAKVANSPLPNMKENENPFTTKAKIANSPLPKTKENDDDPFASRANISNSPLSQENEDPFATKAKIANSPLPSTKESDDPFATKAKVANSPLPENEDPFSTKAKVANSPLPNTKVNEDPFSTKAKVANSPLPNKNDIDDPFATPARDPNPPVSKACSEDNNSLTKTSAVDELDPFAADSTKGESFKMPSGAAKRTPKKNCPFTNLSAFGLSDDDFKPASSSLFSDPADFDVLEQFGSNKGIAESTLSRISLYVKFDPLVDLPLADPRRASMDVRRMSMKRASIYDPRLRQLDPEESMVLMGTPPRGARQGALTPGVKNQTPVKTKASISNAATVDLLCSDTPEGKTEFTNVIKDTLSLNQNSDGNEIIEVLQYTEADILRIKQNFAMELQGVLLDNQKEWSKKLTEKEKEFEKKQKEMKREFEKREEELKKEVEKSQQKAQKVEDDTKEMLSVMKEYEIIIDQLLGEKEKLNSQLKKSKQEIQEMKEQATQDAQSVDTLEASFAALHKRFEKSKEALVTAKENEDTLKTCVKDYQGKLQKAEEQLLKLKEVAEEKLKTAYDTLEKVKANSASETTRLQALIKRKDIQVESTEKSLEQKTKEFKELTELCDQLMQRLES